MLAPVAQAVTLHLKDEEEEEKEEEEEEEQHQSLSLVPTMIGKQGKNMKRIADSCGFIAMRRCVMCYSAVRMICSQESFVRSLSIL